MAIITPILTQPSAGNIHSPYRPMEIGVKSNAATIAKMKCFIHLDDNATADNASTPIILDPDFGTTNEFTFDLSTYIAGLDSLTYDIQTHGTAVSVVTTSNSIKKISCTFTEVLLSGGLLSDGASKSNTTISDWYAINGVWQHDEVADKFSNFKLRNAANPYFLTNKRPAAGVYKEVGANESDYLSGFTTLTGANHIRVRLFSGKNLSGSSVIKFLPITLSAGYLNFPSGVANLNATTSGWVLDGGGATVSGDVIISNTVNDPDLGATVGSYTYSICDTNSDSTRTGFSEILRYNVDYSCSDEHTRIKFMNRLGAFEYFTFKGYRDRSIEVRKQFYKSPLSSSYTVDQGGDRVLNIDSREEFVVYSQPLNESHRIWLEEMLEGFECFVEEGTNYIPIKVRGGKTAIINEGGGLFTIKMTYQYANENRRQNG